MFQKAKNYSMIEGPFERAEENAHSFAFNMLYANALGESLRLIEIAQQQYNKAVEEDDYEMITKKKMELDFCLNALRLSSIAAAKDVDEPSA